MDPSPWYYGATDFLFGMESAGGSHRITIHPYDDTATYGRGGFFIHGGAEAGSAGCIDLTSRMSDLAELIRGYPEPVQLTVQYPDP